MKWQYHTFWAVALVAVLIIGCNTVTHPVIPTRPSVQPPPMPPTPQSVPNANVVAKRASVANAVIIPRRQVTVLADVEGTPIAGYAWGLYGSTNASFSNKVLLASVPALTNANTVSFTIPALLQFQALRVEGICPP